MRSVGSRMQSGHTTRLSRARLVLACTAGTPHATLGLCEIACTAGTPNATLAPSWFSLAQRVHQTPLFLLVGFCMHTDSFFVVADRPSNTMIWQGIAISMIFFYTLFLLLIFPLCFNLSASEPSDLFGGKTPDKVFRSARMHTEVHMQITSETTFLKCTYLSLH